MLVASAVAGREPDLDISHLNARRFSGGPITTDKSVV
jgi:hypothetical protein